MPLFFFKDYALNMDATKYSDKISQVLFYGEQPKPNVNEVDIFLIKDLVIACLLVLFVIILP